MNAAPHSNESFEMQILILSAFVVALCLVGFIIYFIFLYQKKQIQNKVSQDALRANFSQELLKTQIEVQEETFNHISQEIHDNVSQVLSFVKLNLALTDNLSAAEKQQKITESRELVAQAITDLRHLSKSMSFEYIEQQGLAKLLTAETERVNKSRLLEMPIHIIGNVRSLGAQRELVLYRIFQETMNNTLKHANAQKLSVSLLYDDEIFNLIMNDNGNGFAMEDLSDRTGSGLKNIQNRAKLIGANAIINSKPGDGCSVEVSLNITDKHLYE